MVHRYTKLIKITNLFFDYVALNAGMISAYYLVDQIHAVWVANTVYLPIVFVFNLTWLLSANLTALYDNVLIKDSISTFRNAVKTYLIFAGLICVILTLTGIKVYNINRSYLVYSCIFFGVLLLIWKTFFLAIRKSDRALLYDQRKVVIVGTSYVSNDLYQYFIKHPERGYKMIGFFDNDFKLESNKDLWLGAVNECVDYVLTNQIDEIFCTLPMSDVDEIKTLIFEADKNLIRFKLVPEYFDYGVKQTTIQVLGHIPVISVRHEPLENMLNRFQKRLFDITFSIFIIAFLISWLLPLLSIIIKTTSRGPALFKQLRSGRDNKPFWCYKFRSMSMNEDSDHIQATKNDGRVTKIGAFMRRTNLDELPQFFNVLKGNMSVVGPRPHMLNHTKQYSKLIDKYMIRQFLKPGITGWAQVKGLRGETKTTDLMEKRVEADVWYLENWSFLLDLKIIFLTIWNSVKGDENAF